MPDIEKWKQEQENDMMFRAFGNTTEAMKLLEKSPTNRDITEEQGALLAIGRQWDAVFFRKYPADLAIEGIYDPARARAANEGMYGRLCDETELAQMSAGNQARKDYMKFGIEQWQGKLANMKRRAIEDIV